MTVSDPIQEPASEALNLPIVPAEPTPVPVEAVAEQRPTLPQSRRKPLSLTQLAVLGLMFFTFIAAAHISRTVFERLPHLEDEFAYLYQAKLFAGGQAYVTGSEPDAYFWQPFIIQYRVGTEANYRRFAKYTPGWSLVLSVGVALGQPWLANAVLAMLSVGLVYRLGREIFDEAVGVVAALLLSISPMALLINATLMSHTSVMFMTIVFVYAYWRTIQHGKGRYLWAALGGLSIGWVASTRPVTAVAMAAPVALHAISRLMDLFPTAFNRTASLPPGTHRARFWPTIAVLLVMAFFALPTTALWPAFNMAVTGDWNINTYTLLWKYDKVGFCPDCGLNPGGHNLQYGWRNFRADINVWFRDMFGFSMFSGLEQYLEISFIWGAGIGLSWIPLVVGLIAGRKKEWVWFFFMFFVFIVIAGLLYWIGSVVRGSAAYSLRYYYEASFGVCIVAAYGIVMWARSLKTKIDVVRIKRLGRTFEGRLQLAWHSLYPGYFILLVVCGLSVAGYTPDRFREPLPWEEGRMWVNGLYGYNKVGQAQLDRIKTMRAQLESPEKPLLLIILKRQPNDDDDWREYGAAMAVSSPYQNGDIIVVRVFEPNAAPEMVRRFPDRAVLYQIGSKLYKSVDEALAGS